ncbi:MAG TPA: PAS domain S-box protein [Pirellulales bacterium]|jgi:PAS domain S-box-containing protein|nr:PAS domain S-box protein [Pirellulales bacterium]
MSYDPPNGDVSSVGAGASHCEREAPLASAPELARANALLRAEIEERRRTEASLRQAQERFATAFRSDPDALVISRLSDGAVMEVNHSWEQVVGYEAAEVLGKDRRTLQLVPDRTVRDNLLQRLMSDGHYHDEEVQLTHRSGAIRDVRISAETIHIGGETCVLARLRDITEQKAAQRALTVSNERLHMALSAAKMGIWERIIPSDRTIWSAEAAATFGLAQSDSVETPEAFSGHVHPEDRPAIGRRIAELVEQPQADDTYDVEYRIVRPSGEIRWVASKGRVFRDASGTSMRMLGTVMDVTERNQADERAQRYLAELSRIGRIKAADQMASSVAHELNQPLTAIAIQAGVVASLAGASDPASSELVTAANEIGEQARRAGGILHALRDLVKKESARRTEIQLNDVAREVIRLIEAAIRHNHVDVSLQLSELPMVNADRIQIAQVLMNLLQNSIEAMQGRAIDERAIEVVTQVLDEPAILLSIRDTGTGIAPEIAENIFDRFYTTKAEGLGVGLAICWSIAEAHGGKLWFASTPDDGTTFYFRLPIVEQERP